MRRIEKKEAAHNLTCVSCEARVRACEKYLQVVTETGKNARGERYCVHCEEEARENNDIYGDCDPAYDAMVRSERERETFAAYQSAGCPAAYFDDRQAGY